MSVDCCLNVGLTCGMFMRDAVEIPCPTSAAGLYIKTRTDEIVKVHIPVLKFTVLLPQCYYIKMTATLNCLPQNMKLCTIHITDSGLLSCLLVTTCQFLNGDLLVLSK